MKFTRNRVVAIVVGLLVVSGAVTYVLGVLEGAFRLTNTEPKFVVQNKQRPNTVVILVHGIFGDLVETWRNANGIAFFDLFDQDPELKGKFDVYAFGFPSSYFKDGSYSVTEAAKRLQLHVDEKLKDYRRIIVIAHSMGGLVAMRYMWLDDRNPKRVPLMVLFSTPQDQNQVATIARYIALNPSLADMAGYRDARFFGDLDDNWKKEGALRPHVVCAYEVRDTVFFKVVPQMQSNKYCNEWSSPISENHIGIVKPNSAMHDSYLVAARALRKELAKPAPYVSIFSAAQTAEILSIENLINHNLDQFPDEALKDTNQLIEKYPTYANGYRLRGIAYWNLGEFRNAEIANTEGLKRDGPNETMFKIRFNLASVYLAQGKISDARPLIDALFRENPVNDNVRIFKALERLHARDYEAATSSFRELLRLDGASARPFVRMGLGFSLAFQRNEVEALKRIREAVSYDPHLNRVFAVDSTEPLVFARWNYAVFREFYKELRDYPALRKLSISKG